MNPAYEGIAAAIEASRHYACLSPALVARIIGEEYPRYRRDKERVKAVKNRLHQLFGAFTGDRSHALAAAMLEEAAAGGAEGLREAALRILGLHASSTERLAELKAFHAFAFERAPKGRALTIADIGCGFHPFSIPWMPAPVGVYHAIDVDTRTEGLLNRFFGLLGLPQTALTADILSEPFEEAVDIAFALKVLPVMEAQRKGSAQAVIDGLAARLVVVSYPIKSLGGHAKGMLSSYAAAFEGMRFAGRAIAGKAVIGSELVYLLERTE